MNRTFRECMNASASCAGRVLLDAARTLRKALREKRRRALTLAGNEIREKVSGAAKTVGQAVERTGERLQGAAKETEQGRDAHSPVKPIGSIASLEVEISFAFSERRFESPLRPFGVDGFEVDGHGDIIWLMQSAALATPTP